jgi:hypothetical protein
VQYLLNGDIRGGQSVLRVVVKRHHSQECTTG